jgi:dihydroorotate dehydrogenase
MSVVVKLAPDVEEEIKERAAEQCVSIEEYVNSALRGLPGDRREASPVPGSLSGAEMIDYWKREGAFVGEPLREDSVDIVNRMRGQLRDRWKS